MITTLVTEAVVVDGVEVHEATILDLVQAARNGERVLPCLDATLQKLTIRRNAGIGLWNNRPVEELTREELLEVVEGLSSQLPYNIARQAKP